MYYVSVYFQVNEETPELVSRVRTSDSGGGALRESIRHFVKRSDAVNPPLEEVLDLEDAKRLLRAGTLESCAAEILRGAEAVRAAQAHEASEAKAARRMLSWSSPDVALGQGAKLEGSEVVWPDGERYPVKPSGD